jgi:hypothetical protein
MRRVDENGTFDDEDDLAVYGEDGPLEILALGEWQAAKDCKEEEQDDRLDTLEDIVYVQGKEILALKSLVRDAVMKEAERQVGLD